MVFFKPSRCSVTKRQFTFPVSTSPGAYAVVVGGGGQGISSPGQSPSGLYGNTGGTSSFGTVSTDGGGGGGAGFSIGGPGGSSGGQGHGPGDALGTPTASAPAQGNAGGASRNTGGSIGGGGGGAGAAGADGYPQFWCR